MLFRSEDFVGQLVVREQLSLVLEAAIARGKTPDHVLLSGPPGLGKTTLSMIIANEVGGALRLTSGPAIQHPGDLAAVLSSLQEGDVLFIDEIHRLARTAEEMLYLAMEDFRVDIVVGKGPGATAIPLEIPRFTLVGATTRAGLLPGPLRDRFGFTGAIVSDALDMAGASAGRGLAEAAVLALAAGCDLLCIGTDNTAEQLAEIRAAVLAAVASGRLPQQRVFEAAERVATLSRGVAALRAAAPIWPTRSRRRFPGRRSPRCTGRST